MRISKTVLVTAIGALLAMQATRPDPAPTPGPPAVTPPAASQRVHSEGLRKASQESQNMRATANQAAACEYSGLTIV